MRCFCRDAAVAARRLQSTEFFPAFKAAGGVLDQIVQDSEESTVWGMRVPAPPAGTLPAANRTQALRCMRLRWTALQKDPRFSSVLPQVRTPQNEFLWGEPLQC